MKSIKFTSLYFNTIGEIKVEVAKCNICNGDEKKCITIDSSGDEYGYGAICKDCTTKLFSEYDDSL